MKTKTVTEIRVGDRVKLFGKKYVRGTRRPGFNGRFTKYVIGFGALLAKTDPRAHEGTMTAKWTEEELKVHFATHIGLRNATGSTLAGDLTEKNNPVQITDGGRNHNRVIWSDADQIVKL